MLLACLLQRQFRYDLNFHRAQDQGHEAFYHILTDLKQIGVALIDTNRTSAWCTQISQSKSTLAAVMGVTAQSVTKDEGLGLRFAKKRHCQHSRSNTLVLGVQCS